MPFETLRSRHHLVGNVGGLDSSGKSRKFSQRFSCFILTPCFEDDGLGAGCFRDNHVTSSSYYFAGLDFLPLTRGYSGFRHRIISTRTPLVLLLSMLWNRTYACVSYIHASLFHGISVFPAQVPWKWRQKTVSRLPKWLQKRLHVSHYIYVALGTRFLQPGPQTL